MNLIMYKMLLLLLLYLTYNPIQLVTSQAPVIITSPVNQSACVGGIIDFTCVVMFTSGSPGAASWFTENGNIDAITLPGHTRTDDSNGNSAPADVTTVLTVTNVSITDNGTDYFCAQGFNVVRSDTVFLTVFGPPGNVTDLNISKITACSFVVQWSRSSSDPVCGTIWYTVAISSEGGMMIITDNTTMTSYDVTGLNDSTVYHVSVTASNNAGSSNITNVITTTNNSTGLPSSAPNITAIRPLNDTSFTVNWTISDISYNYTVIWTNLNTSVTVSFTVSENTSSYTVAGLSKYYNYNVCVAIIGLCEMMISGCIIVYGPPTPEFDYCISYINGKPALQVISYVIVTTPRSSLSLDFSASYQTGNSSNQSAMCSSLSDMQYNCTAEFAIDINPSVDAIKSVNVTVSGPYGSASLPKNVNQSVQMFDVDETDIKEDSVTLVCQLPCFSPKLKHYMHNFTLNSTDVNVTMVTGNITGSVESYSYPTQTISVSGLNSSTTYNYCVVLNDTVNLMVVGEPVCGSFITRSKSETVGISTSSCDYCYAIAIVIAILLAPIVAVSVCVLRYLIARRSRKVGKMTRSSKFCKCYSLATALILFYISAYRDEKTPSNVPLGDQPLGDNITYGISSHDDKRTTVETRMQYNDGTIRDDRNSPVPPINVPWYDKLPSDDKRSDDENPMNDEIVQVSEQVQQQQVNDTAKPHPFYEVTEASKQQQLEQQSPVNTVNSNEALAKNKEESTATATMSNNNAANRAPLAPINLYDPIQQHSPVQQPSPVVPHLHTSSGDKYALPSPKLGRANKHADNATPVNKEIPPYAKPDKSKKTANKPIPQYSVPDKSKKTANKKNKHSESDVLSPTTDDTTPLTYEKTKHMEVESPTVPPAEDPHP